MTRQALSIRNQFIEILPMQGAFIVVVIIAVGLIRYSRQLNISFRYVDRQAAPVKAKIIPVPQAYRDTLQKYFKFYQALSPSSQAIFEQKVTLFIYGKQFIPRDIDEVTVEAKVLIAASAVQLTFGLPDYPLRHFNRILVYPNDYYSRITRRFHKGEVNPMFGIIVLSWQSFVDGYIEPHDAFNLGLHEMAHALRLETLMRKTATILDEDVFDELDEHAERVCQQMETAASNVIRPYACRNKHEFFSVAVENFFERPTELYAELPQVYAILAKILKQDPLPVCS
jgi:Mlc titration factor MtfA (ptsG expression regulator)